MWYNTFSRRPRTGEDVPSHAYRVCYAESDDGIQWRKPNVGLWEWCGSKDNNLVLCEDMTTDDGRPMTSSSGTQSFSLLMDPVGPSADDGLLHAITKAAPPDALEPPGGISLRRKGGICHIVSDRYFETGVRPVYRRMFPAAMIMVALTLTYCLCLQVSLNGWRFGS